MAGWNRSLKENLMKGRELCYTLRTLILCSQISTQKEKSVFPSQKTKTFYYNPSNAPVKPLLIHSPTQHQRNSAHFQSQPMPLRISAPKPRTTYKQKKSPRLVYWVSSSQKVTSTEVVSQSLSAAIEDKEKCLNFLVALENISQISSEMDVITFPILKHP